MSIVWSIELKCCKRQRYKKPTYVCTKNKNQYRENLGRLKWGIVCQDTIFETDISFTLVLLKNYLIAKIGDILGVSFTTYKSVHGHHLLRKLELKWSLGIQRRIFWVLKYLAPNASDLIRSLYLVCQCSVDTSTRTAYLI